MALIEALVASLVLAVSLTAATRLTLHTLYIASDTRQHTVALALALDALALEDLQVRVQWPTMGPALGAAGVSLGGGSGGGSPGQTQPRVGELVLHGSRDAVPAWLGVSLP
jgi:hypothetical protein